MVARLILKAEDFSMQVTDLPFYNACLNALSTLFLVSGRVAISLGKEQLHRRIMTAAFTTSTLFLASYLYYHFNTEIFTPYQGLGLKRYFYYAMLFTHIVLAIVVTPGIIYLLYLALKRNFLRHKKLAAYIWPIWLYVSATGVGIYYMLY
jgi:putative membrane protein